MNLCCYKFLLMKPVSVRKPRLWPIGSAGPSLTKAFFYSFQHFMLTLFVSLQYLIPAQSEYLCRRHLGTDTQIIEYPPCLK